jgi:hypothetical protein
VSGRAKIKGLDATTVLIGLGVATAVYGLTEALNPRKRILRAAAAELGETDWKKYLDGVAADQGPVAWCGIFALWVLHKAGIARDVGWEYGTGFLYRAAKTTDPKPGDLAYIESPLQHHAIVERVDGDTIYTVDGNSGGTVRRLARPRSAFSAFYDALSLK